MSDLGTPRRLFIQSVAAATVGALLDPAQLLAQSASSGKVHRSGDAKDDIFGKEPERSLATLLIGVDTIFGGNVKDPSGAKHFLVDIWTSGKELPPVYRDRYASVLRESGGVYGKVDRRELSEFIRRHNLRGLPDIIRSNLPSDDPTRAEYIKNQVRAFETFLNTGVAMAAGTSLPSFDERYRAATGLDSAKLYDPSSIRAQLEDALSRAGYNVTSRRNLREAFLAWNEQQGVLRPEEVASKAREITDVLLAKTAEVIFPILRENGVTMPDGPPLTIDTLRTGHRFNTVSGQLYTGYSLFEGGEKDGKALLRGLFEYNTDHPKTFASLVHLVGHEVMPGHYFNSAVADLLWRQNRLGLEITMATIGTSSTAFQEGWAENSLFLLYSGMEGIKERFGDSVEIALLNAQLESVAKHNAGILHQFYNWSEERVGKYIAEECAQGDAIVKKILRWCKDPIYGPMQGPAYILGTDLVRAAHERVGAKRTIETGLQLHGPMDMSTFSRRISPI